MFINHFFTGGLMRIINSSVKCSIQYILINHKLTRHNKGEGRVRIKLSAAEQTTPIHPTRLMQDQFPSRNKSQLPHKGKQWHTHAVQRRTQREQAPYRDTHINHTAGDNTTDVPRPEPSLTIQPKAGRNFLGVVAQSIVRRLFLRLHNTPVSHHCWKNTPDTLLHTRRTARQDRPRLCPHQYFRFTRGHVHASAHTSLEHTEAKVLSQCALAVCVLVSGLGGSGGGDSGYRGTGCQG